MDAQRNRARILERAKEAFTRFGANASLDEIATSGSYSTYAFSVYNSVTNVLIGSSSSSSTTYTFQVPSAWTANNLFYANVIVTDTVGGTGNSILSGKVTVSATPTITITPSSTSIDTGQTITVSNTVTGGTSPFAYVLSANNLGGVTIGSNQITFANAGTYNVFETVTDATGYAIKSANSIITVSASPTVTIAASNSAVDAGYSYETFTASAAGGSGSYSTYAFSVYNSVTNVLIGSSSSSSTTYTFQVPSAWTANNLFYANVIVTDTVGGTGNSILSGKVTVSATPTITITPSSTSIDTGQTITVSNTVTGGTSPFAYVLSANNLGGVTIGSNQITFANAGTYNVFETVTDATGYAIKSANSIITVSASPTVTIAASNSAVDAGYSYETFTASAAGGSGSYSTYAFSVYN